MNTYRDSQEQVQELLDVLQSTKLHKNASKDTLQKDALSHDEVKKSAKGPLLYISDDDSKGRSPDSTYIVDDTPGIDWDRMVGIPRITFNTLWDQALGKLEKSSHAYFMNRAIGADPYLHDASNSCY